MPIIKFTPEDIEKCKDFARKSNNDNYGARNQHNAAVKARQIYQGKLGEMAVFKYLQADCPVLTEPDCNIYKGRQKNWKADLACKDSPFHVKTMGKEQAALYGLSWTFQFSDASGKGGKDKEIFTPSSPATAYIALVEIDLKQDQAEIHTIVELQRLLAQNLFRDPKLEYLKGIKKCVYYDDLAQAGLIGIDDHKL